jgi:hypothetical protein
MCMQPRCELVAVCMYMHVIEIVVFAAAVAIIRRVSSHYKAAVSRVALTLAIYVLVGR